MDNNFEELVEFFNELLEDTRWKQAVRAGQLSGKAVSKLRKSNIIPKQKRMLRGIETGTKNILKKSGATHTNIDPNSRRYKHGIKRKYKKFSNKEFSRPLINSEIRKAKKDPLSHYTTDGDFIWRRNRITGRGKPKTTIRTFSSTNTKNRFTNAIANRHEADEASSIRKHFNRISSEKTRPNKQSLNTRMEIQKPNSSATHHVGDGSHNSASVIAKERKITDFLKNAYGKNTQASKSARNMERYRKRATVPDVGNATEYEVAGSKKIQDKLRRRQNRKDRRFQKQERKRKKRQNTRRKIAIGSIAAISAISGGTAYGMNKKNKKTTSENVMDIINNYILQENFNEF